MSQKHIQGLRGWAAGCVYLSSFVNNTFDKNAYGDNIVSKIIYMSPLRIFVNQEFWIFVFFGITGFVLHKGDKNGYNILRQVIKRYLRLMLPVLIILSFYFVGSQFGVQNVIAPNAHWDGLKGAQFKVWFSSCLSGIWNRTDTLFAWTWPLADILWYSFFVFVSMDLLQRAKLDRTLVYSVLLILCIVAITQYDNIDQGKLHNDFGMSMYGKYINTFAILPAFLIGMLFSHFQYSDKHGIFGKIKKVKGIIWFVIFFLCGSFEAGPNDNYCKASVRGGSDTCILWKTISLDYTIAPLFFIYVAMFALFALTFTNNDMQDFLSKDLPMQVGNCSFMFYLLHQAFVFWFMNDIAVVITDGFGFPGWICFIIVFVLASPLLVAASEYAKKNVEDPCIETAKDVSNIFSDKVIKYSAYLIVWLAICGFVSGLDL